MTGTCASVDTMSISHFHRDDAAIEGGRRVSRAGDGLLGELNADQPVSWCQRTGQVY